MSNAIRRTSAVASRVVLCFLTAALAILACLPQAMAQSATTTAFTVIPNSGASGSIFSLEASVQSGGVAVTGGTVKFTDSYNGVTSVLGTAQVQSANGAPGAAMLNVALAGGGTHSITASFGGTSSYAASASSAYGVTVTTGYPTSVSLGTTGGIGNYTLTAALSGGGNGTPTGDLTFNDTTAGVTLGTVPLSSLSLSFGFGGQQLYGVGNEPDAVAVGDFNGDGKVDLAVANSDNTVSVLLGNGDGTYQTQVTYAVGSGPYAIAVGDFNGDGKLDLAVANAYDGTVSVLLGNGDGTFQTQVTYAVGNAPVAITVGDFNGDGKLDLAVANYGDNTVSVLLGKGDGTFQTQTTYNVGSAPWGIIIGDFNGDGKLDLAIANSNDNTVSVLLGNGDGTFKTQVAYAVGNYPDGVSVGDFNGDGKLDLAVANGNDNTVSVLLSNGDGTFKTQVTYAVGNYPDGVSVGDFNGDGKLDLAVANEYNSTVSVLIGNWASSAATLSGVSLSGSSTHLIDAAYSGDSNFEASTSSTVPLLTSQIATALTLTTSPANSMVGQQVTLTATLNPYNDSTYFTTNGETITFLSGATTLGTGTLSNGVVTLTTGRLSIGTDSLTAVYAGDAYFLGATSPTVSYVVAPPPASTTALSVNPSSGASGTVFTFTASVQASNGVTVPGGTVTFTDSYNGATSVLGAVQVQAANGTAVLKTAMPPGSHSVTATFKGTDNATASASAAQVVTVTGTYTTSTALTSSGAPGNYTLTATVDGFGNGTPSGSVAFNDTTAGVLLGTAPLNASGFTSSFTSPQVYTAIGFNNGGSPRLHGLAIGDFNGDGIPDMAVLNNNSISATQSQQTVDIYLGKGDGTFQPPVFYNATNNSTRPNAVNMSTGDVNGDGVLDLIVSDNGNNEVWVLLGNGDGSFQTPVGYSVTDPGEIAVVDLNGDGYPDLAIVNSTTVSILLNKGNGVFGNAVTYSVGGNAQYLVVGDFNGDGKPDLAVTTYSSTVSVLLGNGDGSFQTAVTYADGTNGVPIAVVDFNGDGKLDLAIGNYNSSGTVSVLLGNGDGSFQAPATYAVGPSPQAIAVGDFNGDGKLDLAVTNNSTSNTSSTISVLSGNGDGTFQPQVAYAVDSHPGSIVARDLNGDGKPDLAYLAYINNGNTGVAEVMLSDTTETTTLSGVSVSGTGTHQVSATYPGDANFSSSTSPAVPLLAGQIATTLTLTTSPASTDAGQSVTLTATLSPYVDETYTTNGETVTFLNGTTTLGTGTLSNGVATLLTYALPVGTDSLTAVYGGDISFQGTISPAVNYVVSMPAATATTLSVSANSGATGSTFVLTATVTSNGKPLTGGLVTFADTYNGVTTTLGTAQVQPANGQAVLLTILAGAGTHSITASTSELSIYQSSVSAAQTITITGAYATSTALATSGSAGNYTLTATVTGFGRGAPIGNVGFNDTTEGISLGTAALSASTLVSGFTAPQTYPAVITGETGPLAVAVGDFNGDGIPDLAVTNSLVGTPNNGKVGILLGNGDGTFQGIQGGYNAFDAAGEEPHYVVTGDFNGDGKLDLAFGTFVLLGKGDGTFAPPAAGNGLTFAGAFPIVGDFNGDGIPDIVGVGDIPVSITGSSAVYSTSGAVFLGNGDGTFQAAKIITSVPSGTQTYTTNQGVKGDFNGDGKLDLAVDWTDSTGNSWISILLGNGDGTFQAPVVYSVSGGGYLAAGDANGDGKTDLIFVTSTGIGLLLGNGDGTFQAQTTFPVSEVTADSAVYVADFNGDGKLDLVTGFSGGSRTSSNMALLYGNGDGTFQTPIVFAAGYAGGFGGLSVAIADFNGDGRPDLVDTNSNYGGSAGAIAGVVSVFLGEATETASLTGVSVPGSGAQSINAAYVGDPNFGASTSSAVHLTGSQLATTLTLSASSTNITPGQQVTFTATLSPYSNGSATTNGEPVIFLNGATTLGISTLSGGIATYTTSSLPTGTNTITAIYAGDAYFSPSQSSPAVVTVATGAPTGPATVLAVAPASGATGSIFTLTAVSLGSSGTPVTGGAVTFNDTYNGVASALGVVQVETANGTAVLKTPLAGAGTHSLTASYSGSAGQSSTSVAQTVTITGLFASATTIASSGNIGDYTLTATVAGIGNVTPIGSVAFNDTSTGTTLGTVSLNPATLVSGFSAQQSFVGGGGLWPNDVAAGDFNGDGIPDLVVANEAQGASLAVGSVGILLGNGDGTFQPQVNYATGVGSIGVTVGDFNGDGKLDVAVTNRNDGTVSVLLGKGDGTFQPQVSYAVGDQPLAITVGDFNGDGKPDLAVANWNEDTVSILLGNGDGTFQTATRLVVGSQPMSIAVGDVNGDGKLDVLVGNVGSGTVSVLLGNGDGTFQTQKTVPVAAEPIGIAVGDFNGDGKLDIAVANGDDGWVNEDLGAPNNNEIAVLLGNGDGTFQTPVQYATTTGAANAIATADINHDGKLDLVVANGTEFGGNTFNLFLGNGDGTFQAATTHATGNTPRAVVVADFNGDGRLDVAVQGAGMVNISLGEPTETATLTNVYVPGSVTSKVDASYSGDTHFTGSTSSTISLEAGQIVTTLTLAATPAPAIPGQLVTLTATLSPATVGSETANGATITFLNGTATLGTATLSGGVATMTTLLPPGANPITAVFAGAAPFTASTSMVETVLVMPATATALTVTPCTGTPCTGATGSVFTFTASVQLGGAAVTGGTVTFQDSYNGVTKVLGAAQIQTASQTAVFKTALAGAGTHTITASFGGTSTGGTSVSAAQTITLTGNYATATALASSGTAGSYTLTATVTGYGNATPSGNVAFNDTTSGATLGKVELSTATLSGGIIQQTFPAGSNGSPYAIATGDFNGDGIADFAVANLYENTVGIYLGKGDGTFTIQTATYPTGVGPISIVAGDFNGDGKLDLATLNYGSSTSTDTTVSILLGNGDGTFQSPTSYTLSTVANENPVGSYIAIGDFNRDGKLDLAAVDFTSYAVDVLLGNGDGTFQAPQSLGANNPLAVAVGDFNGDGNPDIAVTSGQSVSVFLGNGNGSFQAAIQSPAVTSGSYGYSISVADLNGDGKLDLVIGNNTTANVLLGNGDGSFQAPVPYQVGVVEEYQLLMTTLGDFNGDGKPDIVSVLGNNAGSLPGHAFIFLGNGDGTFQQPTRYTATDLINPNGILMGDFNGDGRLDIAAVDFGGGVDVLLNAITETATLTGVSAIGSGAQTVDAAYAGDTNFSGSTSAPVSLSAGITTAMTVTASPATSAPGQPVTLTAMLAPYASGSQTTNGETVTFLSGATTLGTATLAGGVATLTTATLPSGANSITAVYAGDATFGASTSTAFVAVVNLATATTLAVTPGNGATGSVFTLTATVRSNGAAVSSGAVTFTDNYSGLTQTLGNAQILASSGSAVFKTVLAGPGSHSITASFGGIAGDAPSLSGAQTVTLSGLDTTTTTLASSGSAGNYALTATITGYGSGTPAGSVTFTDSTGGINLGTAPLSSSTLVSGFGAAQTVATLPLPTYIVTADFNGDGIPDVAVAGGTAGNQVAIQLGNGDGTFQAPTTITLPFTIGWPGRVTYQLVASGDFNGDGKQDLAVIGVGSVGILLGNGDGTFQPPVIYSIGPGPAAIAVGDLNGDGKPDLVISDGSNGFVGSIGIGVLLGNGDGTFQPEVEIPGVQGDIALGDFNGDGKLDIAVGSSSRINILLGNGNGTFQPPVAYSLGGGADVYAGQIAVADFNGDGKLDIVSYDSADYLVSVLLGNGDGTFQPPLITGFNLQNAAIFAIGDFNGDGKLDLVAASNAGDTGTVGLLLGNGDGTFVPTSATYPDGAVGTPNNPENNNFPTTTWIAAGDFNGDGKLDIVSADWIPGLVHTILGQQVETATLTGVSVPGSGTPSVSAAYSGDTNFGPSSSSPITLTASQIATKLTLTANAPPSNSSQVTLVAVLSPASNGSLSTNGETVTFLTGTTTIGTATLNSGVATLVTTSVPAGATNLTASYPGDANFLSSQSAPTSVVLKAVLTVTANNLSRLLNQANPALTYTIAGFINGDTQASATTGAPLLTTTATQSSPVGSYPITITQETLAAPNYNFVFVNGTLTVTGESQTITFPAIANTIYGPKPITLNATASSGLPVTYTVTGPATVSGSTLTLTGAGTVTVTANQVGNGTYVAATPVSQSFTVSPAVLTATASNLSRAYGTANPALTYTIAGFVNSDTQTSATTGAPLLTTTATQSSALGTYPITITQGNLTSQNYTFNFVNGTLTVTGVPLTVSANNATRAYGATNPAFTGLVQGAQSGDTFTETFSTTATATSSPSSYPIVPTAVGANLSDYTVTTVNGVLTITQAPTTVALTASSGTSGAGSAVTFTAQVASSTTGTPTGTVSFYNGTTLLGTVELNSSDQAAYSSSALAIGSYSITAAYSGDVDFTASISPTLTETIVTPGTFTLSSSSGSQTISAGGTATYVIAVTPSGTVSNPITFTATGLPPGATATFSPSSLSLGTSAASTTLTIQTVAQTAAANHHGKPGSEAPLMAFAAGLLMLPLFRIRAVRRRLGRLSNGLAVLLFLACSLSALAGLSGCGGKSGSGSTTPQVYTVTVTGTSGSLVQTTNVTLTVQ
jgi:hypothetical protein